MSDMTHTPTRLREPSHAHLRTLVEQASDGIFIADTDGRYTFVNQAGCRLLGCEPEWVVGKTILDLIPEEDVPRLMASKIQMLGGERHVAEWELRRKDASWVPVEVSAKILPDGQWQAIVRDISERKAHEAERDALFAKEEAGRRWLQTVLDTLPLGVIMFSTDGRLSWNRQAEDVLGMKLRPECGFAQYAGRVFYPDGKPVPPDELLAARALYRGETNVGMEYEIRHDDGIRVPVMASCAPIHDAEGRIVGGVCLLQDISERRRADERIAEKQRLLQAIFDILPVGVWHADATGRIISNNPAGEKIWKGARYVDVPQFGEYKGWRVDTGQPIAAEDWALARALTKGVTSTGELIRIQCFDGTFKTIINSAAPLRDETGVISGAICVNEDITALHDAQEQYRASERLFRTVFELLPVGLWVADAEGRITLANPAGERIWQGIRYVAPDQFAEYKAWWLQTGKPIAPDEWGLSRAIRRGETARGELIRIQCFDGSFKVVINWATPIRSDAGEILGAIAMNEDITALQQTQEQLRRAVRDREELLAVVAHDLRNPLAGLMMGAKAAEYSARQTPGGEQVRELAAAVVDAARQMTGLVDDLLAVAVSATSGKSMLHIAPVDATALVARAANAARPLLAKEQLTLEVEVADNLPRVNVDAARILRVFANLLDNALKFTTPPGRIKLSAERLSGGVRFSVSNSGPALPPDQLNAMFQPFWQSGREDSRGVGLGLSICRSIVEAHGGSIWAEPVAGERVRVCFMLPS